MIVGRFQPTTSKFGFLEQYRKNESDNMGLPNLPETDYKLSEELSKQAALPGFSVSISKSYFIAQFEITQAQWKKVMGHNPSYFKELPNADQHPVENVSWKDAQAFIKKLNKLEKGKATYRLPTEFEWEYAARAGATDDFAWADIQATAQIAKQTTQPVGQKLPNAWGLYDMLGNVWEWTQDYYNEKLFADPTPIKHGKEHVLKGAPFYGDVKNATYMTHAGGPGSKYDVGFRVVIEKK
jgi:formylglycine-generating enzyme